MIGSKEIISAIEAMEQEKNSAIKEVNDLRVKVWQLEQELEKQRQETERWKTKK